VVEGSATVVDGQGNVVYNEDGDIVLFGVDDLVVVQSGGTTLVMPRARAAALKTLLARLEDDA
jgi:mannose-1-phosphate guanylyltransferase